MARGVGQWSRVHGVSAHERVQYSTLYTYLDLVALLHINSVSSVIYCLYEYWMESISESLVSQ